MYPSPPPPPHVNLVIVDGYIKANCSAKVDTHALKSVQLRCKDCTQSVYSTLYYFKCSSDYSAL